MMPKMLTVASGKFGISGNSGTGGIRDLSGKKWSGHAVPVRVVRKILGLSNSPMPGPLASNAA
jgi:hypothetical protein